MIHQRKKKIENMQVQAKISIQSLFLFISNWQLNPLLIYLWL